MAAANLPYNITTDAVDRLVYCGLFSRVAVMVQKEAARRLLAAPGEGDWCLASARLRWKCRARAVADVPPDCFVPAPRVTSTILCLELREDPLCPVKNEAGFLRMLGAAFHLRRKTFLNSAAAAQIEGPGPVHSGREVNNFSGVQCVLNDCGFRQQTVTCCSKILYIDHILHFSPRICPAASDRCREKDFHNDPESYLLSLPADMKIIYPSVK